MSVGYFQSLARDCSARSRTQTLETLGKSPPTPFVLACFPLKAWAHSLRRPRLLDALQYRLSCPTGRRSRVGPLQFVPHQSERSFLFSPFGVRVRSGLNLKDHGLVADRVGAGIAEASLYRRFVFLRRTLLTVVSHEFGTARTREKIRKVAIGIEDNQAFWIGTKRLDLGAIWAHEVD